MASESAPNKSEDGQELSMEEILQSIRKIIAEEADGGDVKAEAKNNGHEVEAPIGSDVLELTEIVAEEPPQEPGPVDVLKEIDDAVSEAPPATAPIAAPAPAPAPKPAAAAQASSRLLSENAAHASQASLKKMIDTHKASTSMPQFRSGATLEDLVLETMKPMLKEWLDQHLPQMVERIVEREIRKLVD